MYAILFRAPLTLLNLQKKTPIAVALAIAVTLPNYTTKYEFMQSQAAWGRRASYNILTHAALRADNNLPVEELLMDMYCRGLKSDAVTCRSLINGLCKVGKVSAALELHDQMLEDGIMPCVTTYNIILKVMCRTGKPWDAILFLKDMTRNHCEPNTATLGL